MEEAKEQAKKQGTEETHKCVGTTVKACLVFSPLNLSLSFLSTCSHLR
jgi:hypothetical protein